MNKRFIFNFIIALSLTFISTSQDAHQPLKFDFEDVSYKMYINNEKRKIALKKQSKENRASIMMCATSCFIKPYPNRRIWQNKLPDESIITIDKEQELVSITRHGRTISESTFLRNLHKYFSDYPPYKS